ncbi:hypothetical protein KAFR_0E02620 [Kazachstania africana CBS 2517]|uniref:Protein CCC1 n=1 Tax=Kazachstania africana (strain ATCC 22294 / BCRC 22015 / CBS 2517 / CECT 1963 / NBRC 1671 / NRRL Y-8276) TaxID=1071382 RepID=H2AVL5_KAZAF|nr:hypothetical protein KAFR_0E02620 [Kazachstania africana CBS 2517]CCF58415.1 hypothetical protein KAFR_0E02620 [Kazachstania africana CBS 2517]
MSVVAIKNVVSSLLGGRNGSNSDISTRSNKRNNSSSPLLRATNDNNTNTTDYGSGTNNDVESASNYHNHNHNENESFFGNVDPRVLSDLIIGLSDGLTVPFALTAGLSSLGDSKLVITGGFAELISGAISMGLGGYLGAKSELDYYKAEVKTEKKKFYEDSTLVNHEVEDILLDINPNFSDATIVSFIRDLQNYPDVMLDFIIRYGRQLDEPAENRQLTSAITIGGGYLMGGFVPLIPYFFVDEVGTGLIFSIIVMAITLFLFGYFKAQISMGDSVNTHQKILEGFQMVAVGGVAAGAAWFFVKLLG